MLVWSPAQMVGFVVESSISGILSTLTFVRVAVQPLASVTRTT